MFIYQMETSARAPFKFYVLSILCEDSQTGEMSVFGAYKKWANALVTDYVVLY